MKTSVVLNAGSGTLENADLERIARLISNEFATAGHEVVSIAPFDRPIDESLRHAIRETSECLLVGGGDGSVSAAAGLAWAHGKALGVLPGGTMNLYARTLGVPLDIDQAVHELARGEVREVDIATLDDRPFVHQFSIGIHAKAIRLREQGHYGSRFGKLLVTAVAFGRAMLHPRVFDLVISVDGEHEEHLRLSALSVSNNLFGEGHLPFADDPCGGVLGLYRGPPVGFFRTARMVADILFGRARMNEDIDVERASRIGMRLPACSPRLSALLDGELIELGEHARIVLHPRTLKVLWPAGRSDSSAMGDSN